MSSSAPRAIPFEESLVTQMSAHDGGPAIALGRPPIAGLPDAPAPDGRVLVVAFQGAQRTGGYAIRITEIARSGDRVVVTASFTAPPPGSIVAQVLTSPAHAVSIAAADASGVTTAVLLDESGTERARASVP